MVGYACSGAAWEFCVWSGCCLWVQSRAWRCILPYSHKLLLERCAIGAAICSTGLSRDHFYPTGYETCLGSTDRCSSSCRVSTSPLFHLCGCCSPPWNVILWTDFSTSLVVICITWYFILETGVNVFWILLFLAFDKGNKYVACQLLWGQSSLPTLLCYELKVHWIGRRYLDSWNTLTVCNVKIYLNSKCIKYWNTLIVCNKLVEIYLNSNLSNIEMDKKHQA